MNGSKDGWLNEIVGDTQPFVVQVSSPKGGQEYITPQARRISPHSETVDNAVRKTFRDNEAMRILDAVKLETTPLMVRVYVFSTCDCACGETSFSDSARPYSGQILAS